MHSLMPSLSRAKRGFTLIELLVVMAVLGILAAAIMPLGEMMLRAQKERELRQALWDIRHAIDDYKRAADRGIIKATAGESGYPPSLKALEEGVADGRSAYASQSAYFLRKIPRDPFAPADLPAEATWLLRSYASPPDKPVPGADVFDVRSSSSEMAMDGSAYARW
jgi:general secretion pathway protein G